MADTVVRVGTGARALDIHCLDFGAPAPGAPVIVCVHGFNQTAHSYDEFSPRMRADGWHVVSVTLRGHGDSQWSPEPKDYTIDTMANDVVGVVRALGLATPLTLVGMSMGGAVSIRVAAVEGASFVDRLVIVDFAAELRAKGIAKLRNVVNGPLSWPSFDAAVDAIHGVAPHRTRENIASRLRHSMGPQEDGTWTWKVDTYFRDASRPIEPPGTPVRELMARIAVPTLLVHGENSAVLDADAAKRAVAMLAAGRLGHVARAGHSVMGDNPDGFYRVVTDFLADTAAPQ